MAITQSNLSALQALRGLSNATDLFSLATKRLSTGLRVQNAADDPTGLAQSQRFTARLRSFERLEIDNQESRSLVQTAEAGIASIIENLQTIRTLAISSASGTAITADRNSNQTQFESLRDEITSIATNTLFNGKSLLNGTFATGQSTLIFQVGPDTGNTITFNIRSLQAGPLGINTLDLTTQTTANTALVQVDSALNLATAEEASVGTTDGRLQRGISLLQRFQETHENAISATVDADLARETINFARAQILLQSSSAALAQANVSPQNILATLLPSLSR